MNRLMQCLLLLLVMVLTVECMITCKDNDNKPVEWFAIYKLPVKYHPSSANKKWPFPPHLYMDSNNNKFTLSNQNLNETSQALAYTLEQAYSNHNSLDVGYILYNDEKPIQAGGGYTEYYGHTKGVTIFDEKSGLWLVHSVPKFPPPTNSSYMFPDNAVYYGQHILCTRLNSPTDVLTVGGQLMYNEPWIYDFNIPLRLKLVYPVMVQVVSGVRTNVTNSTVIFDSPVGNTYFISFAKNRHFNNDLYAALVAPKLQCNMSVETWQHGSKQNLPSTCNQTFRVENVQMIQSASFDINFKNYYDHSKVALCENIAGQSTWVCIGDVNRQTHQMVRGGGTVCFHNAVVHKQYSSLIGKVEECSANSTEANV